MRLTSIGLIAFAIFFVPVGAKAAPCDPLNRESTVLSLDDQGDEDLSALALGFLFALTPAAFPQDQINAAANPCSRGEFVANNEVFNVFGEDSDVPPRWAVGHGGQIAYLAIMPPPAVTLEWARHGARGPLTFDGEPFTRWLSLTAMRETFSFCLRGCRATRSSRRPLGMRLRGVSHGSPHSMPELARRSSLIGNPFNASRLASSELAYQISRLSAAVAASPVFGVPRGSISSRCVSSSAQGQCSTP